MKNNIFYLCILITSSCMLINSLVFGQSPQKMSYQAVIRNSENQLITNHLVGMKISILQGSLSGTVVYTEIQTPTTNANGLLTIEIGGGASFTTINWANGPYFIKTETDPTGGTSYTITGSSQLLSVPYALNAKTAETADYNNLSNLPTLNIANWDAAYSWGNHATAGYLTSFTETDPLFSSQFDLTGSNIGDLLIFNGTKYIKFTPNYSLTTHIHNDATTSISGFMSNTDKVKLNGIAEGAEVNVNADWNATNGDAQILNKPIVDGSETKISAGNNVTINGMGTSSNPYIINSAPTHYIGELYGGGIVFWVSPDGLHGLVMNFVDLVDSIEWSNAASITINANDLYDGLANSNAIVAQAGCTSSAAKLCLDYSYGGYSDWYLPASWQMLMIYQNVYTLNYILANDGNPATVPLGSDQSWTTNPYYWTSTQYSTSRAWYMSGEYSQLAICSKDDHSLRVRAVRSF